MEHVLDNPVWHALIGPHRDIAIGTGLARQYPPDFAPFSGVAFHADAAYDDLARALPAGVEARLVRTSDDPLPNGWTEIEARTIVQMVFDADTSDASLDASADARIHVLSRTDVPAMLGLAEIAKPGPFRSRSIELGTFLGVVFGERLDAMAGERLRLEGYVELSAISVHPDARGKGLGSLMMRELVRRVRARGCVPFLHVFPDNPAMAVYEHLGFRERTRLRVLQRQPTARPNA